MYEVAAAVSVSVYSSVEDLLVVGVAMYEFAVYYDSGHLLEFYSAAWVAEVSEHEVVVALMMEGRVSFLFQPFDYVGQSWPWRLLGDHALFFYRVQIVELLNLDASSQFRFHLPLADLILQTLLRFLLQRLKKDLKGITYLESRKYNFDKKLLTLTVWR